VLYIFNLKNGPGSILAAGKRGAMEISLTRLGIAQSDLSMLLSLAQVAYVLVSAGLLINWIKSQHAGVLLASGVFGTGAYFSFTNNNWQPLLVAFGTIYLLRSIGFHMGYH
jgi:hypothetical protein